MKLDWQQIAVEYTYRTSRSSGPGGQHVNKTETRVEVLWNVLESAQLDDDQRQRILDKLQGRINKEGVLIIDSSEHRSQAANREEAFRKLQELVEKALVKPKPRKPTKPSKASKIKRLEKKTQRGEIKKNRRWKP